MSKKIGTLYVDPNRGIGSQAENPEYWYEGEWIHFKGYQRFSLSPQRIQVDKRDQRRKYALVRPYLLAGRSHFQSILDLGCSAGAMGFQAYLDGVPEVIFVDHDPEYLELVKAGIRHINATESKVELSSAGSATSVADVLFVFALIHWLYSCTEDIGSLDRIIEKLSHRCRKAMFIEWIGPECKEMKSFGHVHRNPEAHREEYSRANFLSALKKRFPYVTRVGGVRYEREVWFASHIDSRPGFLSVLKHRIRYRAENVRTRARRVVG